MDWILIIDAQTESLITVDKNVADMLNLQPHQRVSHDVVMRAIALNGHAMLAKIEDMKRREQSMPEESGNA